MPTRKKQRRGPALPSRIVRLISLTGPIALRDMIMILAAPYQSLNTECLELARLGVLNKDSEGLWSLSTEASSTMPALRTDAGVSTPPPFSAEEPPTNEEKFIKILRSVGVKEVDTVISEIFFTGDVGDMHWLYRVLFSLTKGYVSRNQAKLLMPAWAAHWGVPYRHEDFFED